jgi:hypothetical protein
VSILCRIGKRREREVWMRANWIVARRISRLEAC